MKLFQADIFSNPVPAFGSVSGAVETLVRAAAARLYPAPLANVRSIQQFGGNEINSNNFKVRTERATFLLKRLPAAGTQEALTRQLELVAWLESKGVDVAPTVPDVNGALSGSHEGAIWCLQKFVEGNFFAGDEAGMCSTAAGLGRLQRALEAAPAALSPPKKWDYSTESDLSVYRTVSARRNDLAAVFGEPTAELLAASWAQVARISAELEARRDEVQSARAGACHCDLHPHNILVDEGSLRAFIDFESITTMPVDAALGYAMYKLIRQHAVHAGLTDRDAARIQAVARHFVKLVDGPSPQVPRDFGMLRLMANAELLRRVLVIFRLNAVDANRAWNHVLPMHLAGLAEMDIIFGG